MSGTRCAACRICCTRLGYAPQVPAHRAVERDEKAIAAWRTQTWVKLRG
jgi:Winged helix-turn helix